MFSFFCLFLAIQTGCLIFMKRVIIMRIGLDGVDLTDLTDHVGVLIWKQCLGKSQSAYILKVNFVIY